MDHFRWTHLHCYERTPSKKHIYGSSTPNPIRRMPPPTILLPSLLKLPRISKAWVHVPFRCNQAPFIRRRIRFSLLVLSIIKSMDMPRNILRLPAWCIRHLRPRRRRIKFALNLRYSPIACDTELYCEGVGNFVLI
jgi:hypothetical protein